MVFSSSAMPAHAMIMRRARGMLRRRVAPATTRVGGTSGFAPSAAWRTLPGGLFGCPTATETGRWEVIGLARGAAGGHGAAPGVSAVRRARRAAPLRPAQQLEPQGIPARPARTLATPVIGKLSGLIWVHVIHLLRRGASVTVFHGRRPPGDAAVPSLSIEGLPAHRGCRPRIGAVAVEFMPAADVSHVCLFSSLDRRISWRASAGDGGMRCACQACRRTSVTSPSSSSARA